MLDFATNRLAAHQSEDSYQNFLSTNMDFNMNFYSENQAPLSKCAVTSMKTVPFQRLE